MEILRQPMEEHCVKLVAVAGNYEFPSDFMLVAAMNPLPVWILSGFEPLSLHERNGGTVFKENQSAFIGQN